ncbi:transcriptional regulator [Dyadobacter luteus]|uniref:Transcriptional regulator n=1 Tax=Dyadobacter luteus TaxID=2259619 RepID=A0A3D8Y8S0_9BACT|nr:helix-turn-helix domain-containing protein [Dyadobacter luteus]REA59660.1 transcriptional regulator [Dyadobacter luteus]
MRKPSSTNSENEQALHNYCDAAYTLSLISGRWKLSILTSIQNGAHRFSLLKSAVPLVTERILAMQLLDLEKSELIVKFKNPDHGRSATYRLSGKGLSLMPLIERLAIWGIENKKDS